MPSPPRPTLLQRLRWGVLGLVAHGQDKHCYCARGSYTGLVFGGTAIIWLLGPGVFLLFLRNTHGGGRYGESENRVKQTFLSF